MSDSYFRVERRPAYQAGPRWRVDATIVRIDTDEPVQRLSAKAATAEAADAQLDTAITDALSSLVAPADWGRDPTVPHLLQRFLQLRDEVYGMVDRREPGAEAYDRRGLALLQAEVEALDEAQLVELSTPTADQIARIEDPWVLDLLAAKKYLCRFITNRSPAVQAGEARLTAALGGEP